MQKKEIILLAALLNALILAFLLTTAVHETMPQKHGEFLPPLATHIPSNTNQASIATSSTTNAFVNSSDPKVITLDPWPHDEVDHALQPYLAKQEILMAQRETPITQGIEQTPSAPARTSVQEDYQEVVIKRGDALDKIARQFGVPVKEIKRINQLTSDRLSIGQLLIVPKTSPAETAPAQRIASVDKVTTPSSREVQNYIMKSGDNPWKIARSHKMKLEDLLELNGWTEESARNLQTGDTIRVYATPAH